MFHRSLSWRERPMKQRLPSRILVVQLRKEFMMRDRLSRRDFERSLTSEELRDMLEYNPETGGFVWLYRTDTTDRFNDKFFGKPAGRLNWQGYIEISIRGTRLGAHRIAWAIHYGFWPPDDIDHINRVRSDNRICNLRLATRQQNNRNIKVKSNNNSGFTGVHWNKRLKKWRARIVVDRVLLHLGLYELIEDAIKARKEAEVKYFGEFRQE